MKYLKISGIEIPVDADGFCSPMMQDVLEFYPKWCRLGGKWSIQGYFCGFCSALETHERALGFEQKDRMQRAIHYFGVHEIGRMIQEFGSTYVE